MLLLQWYYYCYCGEGGLTMSAVISLQLLSSWPCHCDGHIVVMMVMHVSHSICDWELIQLQLLQLLLLLMSLSTMLLLG